MKRFTLLLIAAALLLPLPAHSQDGSVTVSGFTATQAAAADPITITGPTDAKPGETVTCRLAGTPPINLSEPLVGQLAWLIGEDQMFAYVAMPGQQIVPLDVEGTIVFGASGATMRPQVSFPVADAGEYRLLVDWNFGQNQLVEHVVTVAGGPSPDPFPQPDPDPDPQPVPPLSELFVMILEEADDRAKGLEGAKLALHLEQVRSYLTSLPCRYQILDDDQPAAKEWLPLVSETPQRPAMVLSAPALDNRLIGVDSFAGDGDSTIQRLKAMGVKQ